MLTSLPPASSIRDGAEFILGILESTNSAASHTPDLQTAGRYGCLEERISSVTCECDTDLASSDQRLHSAVIESELARVERAIYAVDWPGRLAAQHLLDPSVERAARCL